MATDIRFEVDASEVDKLIEQARLAMQLAMKYTAKDVEAGIGRYAPTDHGRLAGSFHSEQMDDELSWRIYTHVEYAMYVHEGTGVYGPEGHPIVPTQAKALKFFWKKTGQMMIFKGDLTTPWQKASFARWAEERGMTPVFAWVKGMEPRPFADKAIADTEARVDEFARRAVREAMEGRSW